LIGDFVVIAKKKMKKTPLISHCCERTNQKGLRFEIETKKWSEILSDEMKIRVLGIWIFLWILNFCLGFQNLGFFVCNSHVIAH
jgi:hypothetical protein